MMSDECGMMHGSHVLGFHAEIAGKAEEDGLVLDHHMAKVDGVQHQLVSVSLRRRASTLCSSLGGSIDTGERDKEPGDTEMQAWGDQGWDPCFQPALTTTGVLRWIGVCSSLGGRIPFDNIVRVVDQCFEHP